MKAIVITGVGGPEVLAIHDKPTPEPEGDQIRIRVRACGLNRADLLQCKGLYPAPAGAPADIPGLEYAGVVDALGPNVIGSLKPGDRVMGIVAGGGQAEYLLTHERMAVRIPDGIDFEHAAAIPEAFITAHDGLLTQGRLAPGETVLVHAAASGVGTAAVQIAHAMGCLVVGTSRTADKLEKLKSLGLSFGVDTSRDDFAAAVHRVTNGAGVNVLLDLLGGNVLSGNLTALGSKGRLVLAGLLAGSTGSLDLNLMLRKRITIVGTTLRGRPLEEKIAATSKFASEIVPWFERGLVHPVVDSVFPFAEHKRALERLESNQVFGKVVLRLED